LRTRSILFLLFISILIFTLIPQKESLNVDGDFSADDDSPYWWVWGNSAVTRYAWTDYGELHAEQGPDVMALSTMKQYAGHGLLGNISLRRNLILSFNVSVVQAVCSPDGWLRMAVVIDTKNETFTWYTELDFYESPSTEGNIKEGSDFRYLRIGQQEPGSGWRLYRVNVNDVLRQEWGDAEFARMDYIYAIYLVIELRNANATVRIDDLSLRG